MFTISGVFPIKRINSQVYGINISFLIIPDQSFIKWGIIDSCKYYLVLSILVKRRMQSIFYERNRLVSE